MNKRIKFYRAIEGIHGNILEKIIGLLVRAIGFKVLSRAQTEVLLREYKVDQKSGTSLFLSEVSNLSNTGQSLFKASTAVTINSLVWRIEQTSPTYSLTRSGRLKREHMLLTTDFWDNQNLGIDILQQKRSPIPEANILIAPWSHYVDNIRFGGYYDFVMLVAAKISRIKQSLPNHLLREAFIAYPLFNTAYEREILDILGFRSSQIIDSRLINVPFKVCFAANSGDWFYPSVEDILTFKAEVERVLQPTRTRSTRIYISRTGRRRILNESVLTAMLAKYGFEIIEDKPRSIAEQVSIYKNASVIIGPHGASFTNCIWCEPGTHLIELFSANYRPNFFKYLATVMNMTYSAYCHGELGENPLGKVNEDIWISVSELEEELASLLN